MLNKKVERRKAFNWIKHCDCRKDNKKTLRAEAGRVSDFTQMLDTIGCKLSKKALSL